MRSHGPMAFFGLALALAGCGPEGEVESAANPLAVPMRFRAVGTEPFWGMSVAGRNVRYSTPEITEEIAQGVVRNRSAGVESVSGKLGQVIFTLTVRAERCSDGMSDRVYPFAAHLRVGDRELQGCAAAE